MFRVILFLLAFFCASALAGGRMSLEVRDYGRDGAHPVMGLSLDEKVIWGLHVNSWLGMGARPTEDGTKEWTGLRIGTDYHFKYFSLGAGYFQNSSLSDDAGIDKIFLGDEKGTFARVSVKLW